MERETEKGQEHNNGDEDVRGIMREGRLNVGWPKFNDYRFKPTEAYCVDL